jgi:hypothetical protein
MDMDGNESIMIQQLATEPQTIVIAAVEQSTNSLLRSELFQPISKVFKHTAVQMDAFETTFYEQITGKRKCGHPHQGQRNQARNLAPSKANEGNENEEEES